LRGRYPPQFDEWSPADRLEYAVSDLTRFRPLYAHLSQTTISQRYFKLELYGGFLGNRPLGFDFETRPFQELLAPFVCLFEDFLLFECFEVSVFHYDFSINYHTFDIGSL